MIVSNLDELNLYTKNTNATSKYPELHNPPIPKGTILDGEVVVLDEKGRLISKHATLGSGQERAKGALLYSWLLIS
ncbi:hypothetical protein [Paenibacillus alba]|uniref:Uncharacterized protein n=1 Tax=Paenibacillus alba TaxID=1197127 RepID=A0ABU6G183_9BACL|nr:hypothetical protein [Paenibacillus alba]MEC0227921.1 hypothetical protein [Paenibacillus alba]